MNGTGLVSRLDLPQDQCRGICLWVQLHLPSQPVCWIWPCNSPILTTPLWLQASPTQYTRMWLRTGPILHAWMLLRSGLTACMEPDYEATPYMRVELCYSAHRTLHRSEIWQQGTSINSATTAPTPNFWTNGEPRGPNDIVPQARG